MNLSTSSNSFKDKHIIFLLTLDDILLREEWSDLPSQSCKSVSPEADLEVLDMCCDLGLKATLFIPAVVTEKFPNILRNLPSKFFEIAAHGYNHEDLSNLSFNEQLNLIMRSKATLEKATNQKVSGWRSPGLYVDLNHIKAFKKSTMDWSSNVVLPSWLLNVPYRDCGNKIELPINSTLDYNLFSSGLDPKKISKLWFRAFKKVQDRRRNELFTLMLHPWIYAKSRKNMAALKDFLQSIASLDHVDSLKCSQVYKFASNFEVNPFYECFLRFMMRTRATLRKNDVLWNFFTTGTNALTNFKV